MATNWRLCDRRRLSSPQSCGRLFIPGSVAVVAAVAVRQEKFRTHVYFVNETNAAERERMCFVFLSVDDGMARCLISEALAPRGVAFVDAGMGLYEVDGACWVARYVQRPAPLQTVSRQPPPCQ